MRDYLVIDLEATCSSVRDSSDNVVIPKEEMEIIEIGACVVDWGSLLVVEEFGILVKPVRHPILTGFCCGLTGIRQEEMDGAEGFVACHRAFCDWFSSHRNGVLFCSWGGFDKNQLQQDCEYHQVSYPFSDHLNLSRLFTKKTGKKRGNRRAMKHLGLEPTGTHHRGLDDAKNIATMLPFLVGSEEVEDGN